MKKILILLFVVLFFTSCAGNPVTDNSEIPVRTEKTVFPVEFTLENIDVSLSEISEGESVEFNDSGTKIKLNNQDGKYILINYSVSNNETYDIDIDHALEVFLKSSKSEQLYGEYYESKTGRENVTIKPGKTKNILFVCDVDSEFEYEEVVFKYNQKEYVFKK